MNKIIIFGTGLDETSLWQEIEQDKEYYKDDILAFCDNDKSKWYTIYHGIKVLPPDEVLHLQFDFIVIATQDYHYEIKNQLSMLFNISESCIISLKQYRMKMNIQYQYKKNLDMHGRGSNRFRTDKIVVYTAIQGDYDCLKEPLYTDSNITYVCFTDDINMKSKIWNMEYISPELDGALNIRKYKILPHNYFPEFDTSIWVDGSLLIKDDLRGYISHYSRGSDLLCFPHPFRKCIYDEGAEVVKWRKAPKSLVIRQLAHYLEKGYPEDNGLYLGGCLVRNHNNPEIINIMEDWWDQVNQFSKRDQLSLPYVLHKNNYHLDLCDLDLENNAWVCNSKHKYKGMKI